MDVAKVSSFLKAECGCAGKRSFMVEAPVVHLCCRQSRLFRSGRVPAGPEVSGPELGVHIYLEIHLC